MRLNNIRLSGFIALIILSISGCKYQVAEPQWDQDHQNPSAPNITKVNPESATGGVNTIEINGTNFDTSLTRNKVYFDNIQADVIGGDDTTLRVLRPNLVTQSATIKVVSYDAIVVAEYSPYQITATHEMYGGFVTGLELHGLTFSDNGMLYIAQVDDRGPQYPYVIYKSETGATNTVVDTFSRSGVITAMAVAPDSQIVIMFDYRRNYRMDPATGEVNEWIQTSRSRYHISYGDFDADDNFYFGGPGLGIQVLPSGADPETGVIETGLYLDDQIVGLKSANNSLYVMTMATDSSRKLWKHPIESDGSVGAQEVVMDSTTLPAGYSPADVNTFAVSEDGTVYFGTRTKEPIFMIHPDGTPEVLYKGILPADAKELEFGAGGYLYMLHGEGEWNVLKIDVG